jgi:two-component system sensor histidine kinase HydH
MSLRLTVRMVAPTVAVSVALLLLGGVAAWYVNLLQRQSSQLLAEGITEVQAAEELELIGLELRNEVKRYLFMGDQTSVVKVLDSRKKADYWLASAGEVAAKDREKALLARIRQGYAHFYREFANVTRDPSAKDHAQEIVASVHDLIGTEVFDPAQAYRDLSRNQVNRASRRDQILARRMELGLLLLGACGAVAGLLLGYGITRGIHRSLVQLSVPIRDAAGKLNEVVGPITVSSDQTFQELESALQGMAGRIATVVQRLQEAHRAASRAERLAAMGQLAAGLAHELRNPLTSMKILIQSAAEGGDSVKLDDDDLAVLTQEITRLEHTIQVYLDYARPPTLERTPLVLRDVLQETVELVSHRASQFHIQIDCRFPEEVIPVEADIGQIRQVLLNLLLNALDASPEAARAGASSALGHDRGRRRRSRSVCGIGGSHL